MMRNHCVPFDSPQHMLYGNVTLGAGGLGLGAWGLGLGAWWLGGWTSTTTYHYYCSATYYVVLVHVAYDQTAPALPMSKIAPAQLNL